MTSLREIMTVDLYTLPPDVPVARAGELMREHRIRHIPIVGKGRELLGLVTQRDILAAASSSEELERVSDLMRTRLYTVDAETDMRRAALLMQKHKIGCLPVLEGGKLVGIVTDTDYVALAINLLEQFELQELDPAEDFDDAEDLEAF